ncbi:DMT family transporter [Candidatus Gottesmanbacteria bacterium]|nr:DMT family transporter [Candidatus Gottesmanbacteria bacterium]
MFKQIPNRSKGILAFVFLAALYAGTGVVTRNLSHYFTIFQQTYLRTLIAFILGIFFFRKKLHLEKIKKISLSEWLLLTGRSAAMFVFGATLWVKATTITKLANVTFLDALPITATLSFLFLGEKATLKKIFYLAMSFLGVIILSVKDYSSLSSFGYGEFLVAVSGFFFAFRNISRKWHSKLLNDQEITQLMFIFGILMLFTSSLIFGETFIMPKWNWEIIILLFIGGFIMAANLFLTNFGFAHLSAVLGNNILNLEAVFGILFGFLFFGEISSIKELLGGILIVTSVVKMNQLK